MRKNAFDGCCEIRNYVNNKWPVEDRPKDDSSYFGFDPENEELLPIDAENRTPVQEDVAPGYLFRVDFDKTGETFEIVLIS